MQYDKQRRAGVRAAVSEHADNTLRQIRDQNSCYKDILTTARQEVGLDKLVDHILRNDPEWAYQALRSLDDLGDYRDPLIEKAAEDEEWALHTLRFVPEIEAHKDFLTAKAGNSVGPIADIAGFNLLDQGWYNCAFTMFWVNNGQPQPQTAVPRSNWGSWKWSSTMSGGGSGETQQCTYFELENAPLQAGNEVWMYMWVQAGDDIESPFRFTYNPNTADIAYFSATGSTKSTRLSLSNVAAPSS